ncbi:hypothetical protein, partial [Candidatus Methanarcanum hacksteinii]|uniref:hypothetical protein n=1 Tax=Candidatus Methanarcanum hacksteinii TaxID=2911857 RepID=UPI0037DC2153
VLLLIAVATLPGLSFSLSSSVTSYNNHIIGSTDEPQSTHGIVVDDPTHEIHEVDDTSKILGKPTIPSASSVVDISDGSSTGEYSSGKGGSTTLSFETKISFKVYAYSTSQSASVKIQVGSYQCDFKSPTSGYVADNTKGALVSDINNRNVVTFEGTTDTEITITTGGNNSGNVKVYVYLVIV